MRDNLDTRTTALTIGASETAQLLPAYGLRWYLALQNTGAGVAQFRFSSSAPMRPGLGLLLDPASIPGGQGGTFEWSDAIPINAVYCYSATGTTVVAIEGR